MKHQVISGILVWGMTAQLAMAQPKVFKIDQMHSSATFTILQPNTPFTGRINTIRGTVIMDPRDLATMQIVAVGEVHTIDTANEIRDDQLRTSDFFDVRTHPVARYESARVVPNPDGRTAIIIGDLTIHGVKHSIGGTLDFGGYGTDAEEQRRIGFSIIGSIPRTQFDVSHAPILPDGASALTEEVTVTIAIQAVEDAVTDLRLPPAEQDSGL